MSSNSDLDDSKLCKICNKNPTLYCCPRCNILYCSLPCYRSNLHSQCSESFYRECFTEEMAAMGEDPSSKKNMMEILAGMNGPNDDDECRDSDDDDSLPDLAERLGDVDLNDGDAVWERLTEDERKEFEAMLGDNIEKILPSWSPWWSYYKKKPLCEIIQSKEEDTDDYRKNCPTVLNVATKFSDISKSPPAGCVKYNFINVISCYSYMTRFFIGDHMNLPLEAASCLLLSNNLKNNANFSDIESAIKSAVQESFNGSFAAEPEAEGLIIQDVGNIVRGPVESDGLHYMLCALSDIFNLLSECKNRHKTVQKLPQQNNECQFTSKFKNDIESNPVSKSTLKNLMKKIEYYFLFIKEHGMNVRNELLSELPLCLEQD